MKEKNKNEQGRFVEGHSQSNTGRTHFIKKQTWEERFGKAKADKLKQKMRRIMKTKNPMFLSENKKKVSLLFTGRKLSKERIKKQSRTMKKLYSEGKIIPYQNSKKFGTYEEMYGKEKAQKLKKRISLINKGKHFSEETKRKMSEASKGKQKSEQHRKNIKIALNSSKEKRRLAQLGKKASEETKKKLRALRALKIIPKIDSKPEKKTQSILTQLQIPFISHKRIGNIEHAYNCDIFIPSMNLVIECDGDYWHKYPYGREIDVIRNKEMWAKGYHVLRLWENEIKVMEPNDLQNLIGRFA